MAYGNKVKFHYDVPAYIKQQLAEAAKQMGMTATELLSRSIEEEYERIKKEKKLIVYKFDSWEINWPKVTICSKGIL